MRRRRFPIGGEIVPGDGGVDFRVWAPHANAVAIERDVAGKTAGAFAPLQNEGNGYFSGIVADARAGERYRIKLDRGSFPDPASRFQPDGPHGPSQIVDPTFAWTDAAWRLRPPREQVLYELHLGTFTAEGTWQAASERLPELARLGVTMLEVMPIADFPGNFGWGYDGTDLFAPTRLYGTPDDARRFVDRAHALGLAVVLDVVYNHVGPDGNYLREFAAEYFSTRYQNEWGEPMNFDGEHSGPVREFFVTNARYWIGEFHFDGLRLDATQQMFDASRRHIVAEICDAAREEAGERGVFMIGENETQHAELARPSDEGGGGLDALWNDDFHHAARVAATGRADAYYSGYRGTAQEFVSAAKHGFLYQGQRCRWQDKRRGHPAFDLGPTNFITYLQNHDQVANSLRGERLHQRSSPSRMRALTALLLLAPQLPMLFQGQEFAASTPFLFFADHHGGLREQVAQGRRAFLQQFPSLRSSSTAALLADPGDVATFQQCKLDWAERSLHGTTRQMHEDLLRIRREDATVHAPNRFDGAVLGERAFVWRYFGAEHDDRLLVVNLGVDLWLEPAPEPLLSPVLGRGWREAWSSENPAYGGSGTTPLETTASWFVPGEAAVLLAPKDNDELPVAILGEDH